MDLLRWLRPNTFNEPFVDSPLRNNWYQASSYFVSSFALITTVAEDGSTNIGPYQLSFPFEVINDFSWMVISRPSSNTTANLRRTKKCALNFIEFNKKQIQIVNNKRIGHRRTAFRDWDEPERRRHLVRIWLRDTGRPFYQG